MQEDRAAGKVKETVGGMTGDHSKKNEGARAVWVDPVRAAALGALRFLLRVP